MTEYSNSIRNMRGAFKLVFFWVLLFLIVYSWNSWNEVKKAEITQLALLAELESKALNNYFYGFENSLNLLSQDLIGKNTSMESEGVHLLLKRFMQANSALANVVILRPDGQLIASALNPPGSKFPTYANEESFLVARNAMINGLEFEVGRPNYGKLLKEWILPLRFAIRDAKGKLIYIISAPLPLSQQQNIWKSFYLPANALIGLLRDDGFLMSLYPIPELVDEESSYSRPRTGIVINYLKQNNFPEMGMVEGLTTRHENSAVAFHRLVRYPVTLFVATPVRNIVWQWWKRNQAFYLLTIVTFLSGFGFYRWLIRRQLEWEAEREKSSRAIIEINRARDNAEKELLALELDDIKLALDLHSIVSIANVSGDITYVNGKFCKVSGYSNEELLGKNHRILNSGLHSGEFFTDMWVTISSGQVWNGEIRNRCKDGSFYWVDSTIVPFLDKNGVPYQYVSIRTDITPYIEARAAAEAASRTKSQFLSSMSHELRTPLNSILGFAQVLEAQIAPDQEDIHESIRYIISAGDQLLGLINDLLDLSRIEIGKLDFNIQSIRIAELASSSVSIITSSMANKRNIPIDNTISDANLLVKGDNLRIRQVLINLLNNAVKYNREDGKVTLSCVKQQDGKLRINVTDTGDGIANDKLQLLFKHFERLDQKHGTIDGAGIGLFVCKQLVETMGGEIGVESVKGQGSTFWFALPLAD